MARITPSSTSTSGHPTHTHSPPTPRRDDDDRHHQYQPAVGARPPEPPATSTRHSSRIAALPPQSLAISALAAAQIKKKQPPASCTPTADSAHDDDDPSTTMTPPPAPNGKPHLAGRTPGAKVRQTPRKPGGRVMALLPTAAKETPDEEGERTPTKVKQTPSKVKQMPSKVGQSPSQIKQSPSKIKQTPHKPGGRVMAPVTPTTSKRKGDAAAAAAMSSGQPGSRTADKKRGKGKEVTKDVAVRPLPAPKQLCRTGNSPVVVVKEEKEEEVSLAWSLRPWEEKIPHPFVRRSLFFDDPRFTFFD